MKTNEIKTNNHIVNMYPKFDDITIIKDGFYIPDMKICLLSELNFYCIPSFDA